MRYLHNRLLLSTLMPLVGLSTLRTARAQSVPPLRQSLAPKREEEEAENPYLTGTWGGARSWLEEHGVDIQGTYTADAFARVAGGPETDRPYAYLGSSDASVDVDTGALGAWDGGTLELRFKELHGEGLTEAHLGGLQPVSNLEADRYVTLAEYWYRQEFVGGALALKVGRQEANVDFAASDYAGTLINASFGVFPTLELSTYPDWALGAAAFATPVEALTLQVGVFDGEPDGKKPLGGTRVFRADTERLYVGEIQLHSAPIFAGPPGTLRLGGFRHGASYGGYAIFDHQIWQSEPSVGVFVQIGLAPQDQTETWLYSGTGLALTGLVPGRDEDVLSLGVARVQVSPELEDAETVVELAYEAFVTGFVSVKPTLQYIDNPGGQRQTPSALVTGLRAVITL
ncbi:MAG: carbohydrate porin [Polyangiaceae bacterium]